jgi:hypothetical protein
VDSLVVKERIMNDKDDASDYKRSYMLFTLAFQTILPLDETRLILWSIRKDGVLGSDCKKY